MYICICNAITDKQIRKAAGHAEFGLQAPQVGGTGFSGCGSCMEAASEILAEYRKRPAPQPTLYSPAAVA